jgi:hypothetical protein
MMAVDVAVELDVGGAIDGAHAAFAELGGDAVVRDLSGLRGHRFKSVIQFCSSTIGGLEGSTNHR